MDFMHMTPSELRTYAEAMARQAEIATRQRDDYAAQLTVRNRQVLERNRDRAYYRDEIRALQRSRDKWRRRAERLKGGA